MRFGISERMDYTDEETRELLELTRREAPRPLPASPGKKMINPPRRRVLKLVTK
jgi:hypothetical protein